VIKPKPSVVIVGGGITGLATAHYVRRLRPETKITLLERAARVGGNIRTEQVREFVLDAGPDSFLRTKPAALALCKELGLERELVSSQPAAARVCVARAGRLEAIPEGLVLGVPTRLAPLVHGRFLSLSGRLRMLAEAFLPRGFGRTGDSEVDDESILAFITRRFGREAAERFVAPLLAGIYAGDASRLSLAATFPHLGAFEQRSGSVTWGLLLAQQAQLGGGLPARGFARLCAALKWLQRPKRAQESPFVSLRGGMGTLIATLASSLGDARILTGQGADAIERTASGWSVSAGGRRFEADQVVLASQAHFAAGILPPGELARELRAIRYTSTATVFFGFDERSVARRPEGSGFIVPPGEGILRAGTWISNKWAGRAPDGSLLARAFLGGDGTSLDITREDDETLVRLSLLELERLAGRLGEPRFTRVHRHTGSNPQPSLGHRARLARIESTLRTLPGLHVAGAAYDGVSIADCVRQARAVAERIASAG